jgi:hypothetical protein
VVDGHGDPDRLGADPATFDAGPGLCAGASPQLVSVLGGQPMTAGPPYRYVAQGRIVKSRQRLTVGEVTRIVRKANDAEGLLPVYDATGNLIGLMKPADLVPVRSVAAPDSSTPNVGVSDSQQGAAGTAAAVAKARDAATNLRDYERTDLAAHS